MDAALKKLIKMEVERQELMINLIPSENIANPEMLALLGSPLVNKYSEGYPGRRYYPGNVYFDEIEELAKSRALRAFGLTASVWGVNVQPYSGSPANQAIYFALMKPGDILMGLSLSHGGHLTHGHLVSFSGILYQSLPYTLDVKTGRIDYANLEKLARKHRPKVIVSGATAYPRNIDFKRIGAVAKKVNAYHVADISHIAGLIAAGLHPSPFPHADAVMATTHKTLRGPRGAVIFSRKTKVKSQKSKLTIAEAIDKAVFPGLQGGPHNNVTAAIAWAFGEVGTKRFTVYARQVVRNARALAASLRGKGFHLVSGGTDNHLMLVRLGNIGITGTEGETLLESAGMLANRNSVPGDEKPFRPTGIRLGTPSATSRGMKEKEMKLIAGFIFRALANKESPRLIQKDVHALCRKFPLPYRKR